MRSLQEMLILLLLLAKEHHRHQIKSSQVGFNSFSNLTDSTDYRFYGFYGWRQSSLYTLLFLLPLAFSSSRVVFSDSLLIWISFVLQKNQRGEEKQQEQQ